MTKQTKLLIVGELGWPLLDDGRPSNKLSRATTYGVPVVSERRFLEWIGKAVPDSVHKTYSADQLAALSKLSSDMIYELAQFGLLDERGGRFGFRHLASARQIAKLLADGVRLSEIIRGVSEVRKWLPEVGLANVRFRPGPLNSLEVEQPWGRTDKHGQFVLAVDESRHNPDDLFSRHSRLRRLETFRSRAPLPHPNEERSNGCIGTVQSREPAPGPCSQCRSRSGIARRDAR